MTTPQNTVYCLLGAFGDLAAMLPMFYAMHARTGIRPQVIVSKTYAPMLEGVSYVEPLVFDGHWTDIDRRYDGLSEFVAQHSGRGKQIIYLNPRPGDKPEEHVTPSYLIEMWRFAGWESEWNKHPLVFDRRNSEREKALVEKWIRDPDRPVVLYCLEGRSSPFENPAWILNALLNQLPENAIAVDLAKVKAERFYDVVALYENADALVTIDTAHAHLCRAVPDLPAFVFSSIRRGAWSGTPFFETYAFHCRYDDVLGRMDEFKSKLKAVVAGADQANSIPKIRIQNLANGGYNPTLLNHDGGFLMAYRWHPQDGLRSRISVAELSATLDRPKTQRPALPPEIDGLSTEDPRLFTHQGRIYMSYTVSRIPDRPAYCSVGYGEFRKSETGQWTLMEHIMPAYGRNSMNGMEKNWVFFSHGQKLYAIYKTNPEQVILQIDKANVVEELKCEGPRWDYGEIHGGTTPMLYRGHYLRFFHSRLIDRTKTLSHRYYVGAALMEVTPPFRTLAVSREPIMIGNERWYAGVKHWKPNVVFPGGCVHGRKQDEFWLAIGVNDSACYVANIHVSQLNIDGVC